MKKEVYIFALIFLLLIVPFVISAETEDEKVDRAYDCLESRINESCSSSLDDNIFVMMATGDCRDEVVDASSSEECWPAGDCRVKQTAQAMLAYEIRGRSTDSALNWLVGQTTSITNLEWLLQIESSEATTCTVNYQSLEYTINIGEDKKIDSDAGACLQLYKDADYGDDWWLEVSPTCYEEEFEISCDKGFLTNLLFKNQDSLTIHVLDEATSASAGGTTIEKVKSECFTDTGTCNYEATLWAVFMLNYLDENIDAYVPYLLTMKDEYPEYMPEVFLYMITDSSDFRNEILDNQKVDHWDESGDKLYDTALALYPFQGQEPSEKTSAKEWLFEEQNNDGCWGSIKNTAFILHSVWQRNFKGGTGGDGTTEEGFDCVDEGYFCMGTQTCEIAGGSELDYDCPFPNICCNREMVFDECADQGGEICSSDENCISGTVADASDVGYGEQCCVNGYCQPLGSGSSSSSGGGDQDCESSGGTCRVTCQSGEQESYSYTCAYDDSCCFKEGGTDGGSYWWIWLLLVLIILTIIAIIFRDRLQYYWSKYNPFNKKKRAPPGRPEGGIPMVSPAPMRRPIPRRILSPSHRRPMPRRPPQRRSGELDDVLKKLKEIGK